MSEGRLDLDEIRAVIRLAAEADIVELEVEAPHIKVRVRKAGAESVSVTLPSAGAHAGGAAHGAGHHSGGEAHHAGGGSAHAGGPGSGAAGVETGRYVPIVAPMVGTFYRASKPDAAPFVDEGDQVELGQVVCVLEAMKLFNEIRSEVAGRIIGVLAENGAPVEYGQPLFLIDPSPA